MFSTRICAYSRLLGFQFCTIHPDRAIRISTLQRAHRKSLEDPHASCRGRLPLRDSIGSMSDLSRLSGRPLTGQGFVLDNGKASSFVCRCIQEVQQTILKIFNHFNEVKSIALVDCNAYRVSLRFHCHYFTAYERKSCCITIPIRALGIISSAISIHVVLTTSGRYFFCFIASISREKF